jgi:glutathione synthase/RimK-type ligase-like ATP-grasp enzyme
MTRYKRVALVTCSAHPQLFADEHELLPAIAATGATARAVVWNDPSVPWREFDRVVLRSTWDYFHHVDEFIAWLDRMTALDVPLVNSASLVRWNLDKHYLAELGRRGVALLPSLFVEPGTKFDLAAALAERGWRDAVVKPVVSGGARHTHRVSLDGAPALQREVDALVQAGAILVQPFADEIVREGEWSFFFFGGALSHVIVKRPAASDFRVQTQFGGTFERVTPPPSLLADAHAVMKALPEAPLYARIDGIRRDDRLLLMEAELIEPYLFFPAAPEALARYVALLVDG